MTTHEQLEKDFDGLTISVDNACALIDKLRSERRELRNALQEAIDAIQVFHGPGWEIYRDHSPEMKRWKALLGEQP